jgi:hypothetical protein
MNTERRSLSERIAGFWQDWCRDRGICGRREESPEEKLERAALKLGLPADEVFAISIKAHYTTNLLPLRMALLGLNPSDVAHSDTHLFRSLETTCRLCDVKGRCAFNIAQNPAARQWQEYCPNAATLCSMKAQRDVLIPEDGPMRHARVRRNS